MSAKKQRNRLHHEPLPHISLFDSINQIAYVADPKTYEVLYVNKYFEELLGENPVGKKCYEAFQQFKHPCEFCTNKKILKNKGKPHEWEYHNPVLNRDFSVTDRIIKWHDGRDVRFELAIDVTHKKETEEKLKKTERGYKELANSITDAFFELDSNLRYVFWNKASENLTGIKKKEAIGKSIYELFPKNKDMGKIAKIYKKVLKTKKTQSIITDYRLNGKKYFFQISVYPSTRGIVVISRDITGYKKAEESVKESEKKYRFLFRKSHGFNVIISSNGTVQEANTTSLLMLGYKKEEVIGRSINDFIAPWQRKVIAAVLKKTIKGKKTQGMDVQLIGKDGTIHTVMFSPGSVSIQTKDGIAGFLFSGVDITKRKQAEHALRESEERYRLAQRAAEIGSWDWNLKTGNLVWSEEIEPLFGFKKGEFNKTYEAFLDCVHPNDRPYVLDAVNACMGRDAEYDIEHRIRWPDGSVHWVRETGDVIRDEDGKPIRMLGIVQDITGRKKTEEVIQELNINLINQTNRLQSINEELKAFSYSVSHDLRAPLRSIDGFGQALLEDYADKLNDEGKDYLIRVRKATQQMGRIIDDLLKLSRITRHPTSYEKVDLARLSRSVLDGFKKQESTRKVNVSIDNDLTVMGDKQLLFMALENLIGNAWKFTSKTSYAKIEVGKMKKDGKDVFYVRDNGAGFNMKYADKLFVPFQRLHSTDDFSGMGIGLGIVSRIIHRHGGEIWAEGKEGKGATFYFSLRGDMKNE